MTIEDSGHAFPMDYKSWIFNLDASAPQFLHAAIRVRSVETALRFYVDGLGMMVLDRIDLDDLRITALFLGFAMNAGSVELICNWDERVPFAHGAGFSHLTIGVPDIAAAIDRLEAVGAEIVSRPAVSVPGAARAAFVKDPDGYSLELVQTNNRRRGVSAAATSAKDTDNA